MTEGDNGTTRFVASTADTRGLVFRAGTYNKFGGYALSNVTEGNTEYYDLELLSIAGEVPPPSPGPDDPDPTPQSKCYKPKATPAAGFVPVGTAITFTCSTANSHVVYHTGDGNWVEFEEPIVLNEDITFIAKSQAEGKEDSDEVTFAYTVFTPGEEEAVLVTDVNQLRSGDRIILVAQGYNFAMGTEQRNNNRGLGNVIKDGTVCTYDSATQILVLEAGTTDDTYALYTLNGSNGYLYAPTDSGNLLRTNDDKTESGSFYITITADGTATITANTVKLQNTIFYNTSKLFSCYDINKPQKPICIYKLGGQERPELPKNGETVSLYSLSARGVLSAAKGSAITTVEAELKNGLAQCSNGAFLFKTEIKDGYYRFYNESFGYLSVKGNSACYSTAATEESDWTLEAFNGGYKLLSRDGRALQVLDRKAAPRTKDIGDRDTLTFLLYPCGNEVITEGVVNLPEVIFGNPAPAYAGQDYLLPFSVDAVFGVKELTATLGTTALELKESYGRYTAVIPAELVQGVSLTVTVRGTDGKGVAMESSVTVTVKDEPMISNMQPVANSQTRENKRPVISAKLSNAGDKPTVTMTVNGQQVAVTYADGTVTYAPTADMTEGRTTVILTVTRQDGKTATKKWSFTVGEAKYILLYGQLHSHTGEYSDGSGTLASALEYIAALPEEAKVDFVAFTDHSNSFDKPEAPNPEEALYDLDLATPESREKWTTYKTVMAEFNKAHANEILALPGFEMTWSGGPGHMNTFVTEGIVSRNNKTLNNKAADAGMRAYYELLTRDEGEDSITQLNHPGATFGNFTDFSYWTPEADSRVYLVEVGNGEGPIPSAGYFPSYEQYNMALDKGWHVAPTNNQDNHKGKWGNANEGRDVILAEEFTEEAIYDAIRNYRVYATEDRNLEILYTVNELPMGTIIENVPETLQFSVSLKDPDSTDSISSVELIVNSGKVAYTWSDPAELAAGVLTAELEPEYSYYYVRVIQADKDIAVTAPVWVGENLKLGIREAGLDVDFAVVGEELNIQTKFYNDEMADAIIKNIIYTVDGSQVLFVDNEVHLLSAGSEEVISRSYTPTASKLMTVTVTAVVEYDGREYTFTAAVELDVAEQLVLMGIDGSHLNEYVSGKYTQMMNNFATLAKEAKISTKQLNSSEALLAACADVRYAAIVLNVPSRQLTQAKVYSEEELNALKAFRDRGGILIISSLGDKGDLLTPHMAATQNSLLEALGSSLRFMDDAVKDGSYNTVYADAFGTDPLTEGLEDAIEYYNGSSLYAVDAQGNALSTLPTSVSPVLFGNSNSVSKDEDADGLGGTAVKYSYSGGQLRILLMAAERVEGKGMIFLSGVPFMNDYNVVFPAENGNNALAENLLREINPLKITPISEVRKQTEVGYKYNIEGVVTSNASGYDKDTAFFDCIYVQDETSGINCFPVAGEFKIGDIVRISGATEFYIGEPELQVQTIEKIGETQVPDPVEITASQLNSRSVEGMLVTLKGRVVKFTVANGLVDSIYIMDANGDIGRAFIDGYITPGKAIENLCDGSPISVTGLGSYDNTYAIEHDSYARIRVRDRADIIAEPHTHSFVDGVCTDCGMGENILAGKHPFTDVDDLAWFAGAVQYVYKHKLMSGMKETVFGPDETLTRAMIVTILHRMAGSPKPEGQTTFTDVPAETWYTDAVTWGYENGIVAGKSATQFDPETAVTREQMVAFLYRFAIFMDFDTENYVPADLSVYEDAWILYDYSRPAFAWAVGMGIVSGMGHNNLAPQGTATRAQVAQLMMTYHRLLKNN